MTSQRSKRIQRVVALVLAVCVASSLAAGCKKKAPKKAPPPPPPAKAPPPPPTASEVAELLTLSPKVKMASAATTDATEDQIKASLLFVDAFARGDAVALRPMLDSTGKSTLDDLVASGDWHEQTARIQQVSLRNSSGIGSSILLRFVLSMDGDEEINMVYEGLARGDTFIFEPLVAVAPPQIENDTDAEPDTDEAGDDEDDSDRPRRPERPTTPRDPRRLIPPGRSPG